jgi:amino acid adenylation domain-containing protein
MEPLASNGAGSPCDEALTSPLASPQVSMAGGLDLTRNVLCAFDEHVALTPNAIAAVMGSETLSYAELDRRSNRLAWRLRGLGVTSESLVAIHCDRSLDMLVGVVAVLKAGGAYVPLDPAHPTDRISAILHDARPVAIITQMQGRQRCPSAGCTVVPADDPTLLNESAHSPGIVAAPASLAYLIFTSGSTGRPKGVEVTHAGLTNFLHSMAHTPGMGSGDRILSVTTLSFDIAGLEMLLPLYVGASVEIADRASCLDVDRLQALLAHPAVTMMQATPSTWRMLVEADWPGKPALRALCGGEALQPDLLRALLPRVGQLWNLYGPTETTVWSTVHRILDTESPISIGRPIDNTSVYVLDPRGDPVPPGVTGELCIGGLGVARGYRDRPELTQARFVADPFLDPPGRMFRTGDLGRVLVDGNLLCLGRIDAQVKIRGVRIELGEIESALADCPGIGAAVVVAREDSPGLKYLVAYFEAKSGPISPQLLRATLAKRLPSEMIPAAFVQLPALPLGPSGKLDRRALPAPTGPLQPALAGMGSSLNDFELIVHTAFCEILGVSQVDPKASFFDLGGNSLLAVRLVRRLARGIGCDVPVSLVLSTPSIRGLAQSLGADQHLAERPRVLALRPGSSPEALFCVCGVAIYHDFVKALPAGLAAHGIYLPMELRLFDPESLAEGRLVFPTVVDLATAYVSAIRTVQPTGPYRLAGISFGGVVAYEIARQLAGTGEQVKFVALLDALLPEPSRALAWLPQVLGDGLGQLAACLKDGPRRSAMVKLALARWARWDVSEPRGWDESEMEALRNEAQAREIVRYARALPSYDGDVVVVNALDRTEYGGKTVDAAAGWSRVVRGRVWRYDVPGGHLGILRQPNVGVLAANLAAHLP